MCLAYMLIVILKMLTFKKKEIINYIDLQNVPFITYVFHMPPKLSSSVL